MEKMLPFQAGDPVVEPYFYNREELLEELYISLVALKKKSHQDFAFISPRRFGKSSVLKGIESRLKKEKIVTVYIDLSRLPPFGDKIDLFIEAYLKETLEGYHQLAKWPILHTRIKELIKGMPEAARAIIDSLEFGIELKDIFTLWIRFKAGISKDKKEILEKCFELPQKLAEKTGIPCVVFFDEFQEIYKFNHKMLWYIRSIIQYHKNVAYVISGSSVHLMTELTGDKESAFYQLFMVRKLEPFTDIDAKKFLKSRIKVVGMKFTEEALNELIQKTAGIPFYLQWIGLNCYYSALRRKTKVINGQIVEEAYRKGLSQFPQMEEELSKITGKKKEIITFLAINPSATVSEIAKTLKMKKSGVVNEINELIQMDYLKRISRGEYKFVDNVFEEWLRQKFTL